ncbi:MAG: hypothetical protein IJH71_09305 [Eubacterium sp.]|nr:hypothetical protein [Eubacterium sp.]
MKPVKISFQEKKVSRNAVITVLIGIGTLAGFALLLLISVLTGGGIPFAGGVLGCLFGILAMFGVLWGVFSYDDARTNQRYKITGIVLNIITVFAAITLIMMGK